MARLLFECLDREGHRVFFETSDKDGQELSASYDASKQWLIANGFALIKVQQGSARPRTRNKVRFDGIHCPHCHGAVWDNRPQKQADPAKSKWPDFACKDKTGCRWVVWPGQYELA